MKFIATSKGFSLIEVMIAFGLLSVVAMGYMQLTTHQAKQTRTQRIAEAQDELIANLRGFLGHESVCRASFQDIRITPNSSEPVTDIRTPAGAILLESGQTYHEGHIKLVAMNLAQFKLIDQASRSGYATLEISLEKQGAFYGSATLRKELVLAVERSPSNQITGCTTVAKPLSESVTKPSSSKQIDPAEIAKMMDREDVQDYLEKNPDMKKLQQQIQAMERQMREFDQN